MKKRKQYSAILKTRIVHAVHAGALPVDLAGKHNIDVGLIYTWVRKAKGDLAAAHGRGVNKKWRESTAPVWTTAGKEQRKPQPKTTDAERIVTELLASLKPGLVIAIGKLVDLGVERKLANARTRILDVLKGAA